MNLLQPSRQFDDVRANGGGDIISRPQGVVTLKLFRSGRLIKESKSGNLFVNSGLPALAALLGGDGAGEFASAVGFGSGSNAPAVTDTALAAPVYFKALDSHSEDGAGSVTFNWSLTTADTAAIGITVQEIALFANKTSVVLPGTTAPGPMLARKTISPIAFTSGMSLSGTWTLTF